MSPWAGSLRITSTWQVQASERAYWGTTGRGSAHIEGRTSRDALDHLYWINDLKGNDEKRGARQCFALIPTVADLLKHGATYFAELLHYRDAAVAAAAAAGAGPLPVAGIIMIMMMITHPISSSPCIARGHISTRLSIYTGPLCVARINSAIPLGPRGAPPLRNPLRYRYIVYRYIVTNR